jgi:hypothetical protein
MFGWRKKAVGEFPKGFRRQRIGACVAEYVHDLSAAEVAVYFHTHPQNARALLQESYDKRYTPSTFLTEDGDGFSVGWFSRRFKRECVRHFSTLADAAADYLLLSLGRGRWSPPDIENRADGNSEGSVGGMETVVK